YPQEEILVQEQVTGTLDWKLENLYEWHAVAEAMYLMGLKDINGEFGERDNHLVFSMGWETPALKCWGKIPQSLLERYPYQAELTQLQQKII
ncbi:MAG: hypothetical protein VX278_03385, partial [Myxococcota bacterium]|nr:hypothetical protein [Myxococcota bacterium]